MESNNVAVNLIVIVIVMVWQEDGGSFYPKAIISAVNGGGMEQFARAPALEPAGNCH